VNEKLIAKLLIAGAGIAVFLTGVRTDLAVVRWTGIALVTVAFLLRFLGRKRSGGDTP
jgi:hypothetical protein